MKIKAKELATRVLGFVFFMLGLGGLAGACEGQGSFILSAVALSLGIFLGWVNMNYFA